MIYTMWDCTDWRKLLVSYVDLFLIIKGVIIKSYPK
jgi:hypothetical protein